LPANKWEPVLPDSAGIAGGGLALAGLRIDWLAERYETPLYIYDETTLRNKARHALEAFAPLKARVSFAAKACSTLGVLRILRVEMLGLDVVSGGELEAGLRADFTAKDMHLHGNCKTASELETAVEMEIRAIVLDNTVELSQLETVCARLRKHARVWLRMAPSLEAETHPYLRTTGRRVKFGFASPSCEEQAALNAVARSRWLKLSGLHVHLGSQITDVRIYQRAAQRLIEIAESVPGDISELELSLGGGWAVAYRPGDSFLEAERVAAALAPAFEAHDSYRAAVEPGRALVARAALAVYRVGSVKKRDGVRIVAVDGGMGDNPRPALYGTQYAAILPSRPLDEPVGPADIVGRYCESGDVLARDVLLPPVAGGDLVCIPVSGAYQLSMASTYNLVPQPAVISVRDGEARLLTRRATHDDLFAREI